ncbi:protein JINGUBANG [Physcomitrium patens]|uniref:Uncharacterized protein n=1 Tax=Physcomitrium patens TaxID=3218 RepID=A0A2K1KQ10_PHYPA|nr:protein JINGUBANG-like [Physcomitrium patens]PNR55865.1 hypothetical protein PHYPA_006762 [Physcomitrium patens]|eukprot:XP_024373100.1 protein JINGUBANG-like [Physcomitrella patens]
MGFNVDVEASSSLSGYQSSGTESLQGGVGSQPHRCLAVLSGHEGHVVSLALVSDQTLYSGSDRGDIRVSRWPPTQIMQDCDGSQFGRVEGSVKAMVVVGHKIFTAHQDQKIRMWKCSSKRGAATGHKLVATLPTVKDHVMTYIMPKSHVQVRRHKTALWIDHHDTISVLALGKGVLYSGSWDKTIKVWRLADLKCVESISAHIDAINALAADQARGFLYSGSADGTVKVWERSKTHLMGKTHLIRHAAVAILEASKHQSVNALALTPQGTTCYAGSSDKCIAVWEMDDEGTGKHMKNVAMLRGHRLAVLCLATVANLLVSGSADKTIRVWKRNADGLSHQCLSVLHGHTGPVKCLAAMLDSAMGTGLMVYSGSMDRSVRVWWTSLIDQDAESGTSPSSPDLGFHTPRDSPFPPLFQAGLESVLRNRLQQCN